ncbi:MAG: AAA family ATPase [Candidatus Lokiarchaeota archaeon]|nr:AAA family ATPase [Candidatus Lokiarchaeota archaeon]
MSFKKDDIEQKEIESQEIFEFTNVKTLTLRPIGYPISSASDDKQSLIRVDNPKLFEAYALEQWSGFYVQKHSYIFDQFLYPDFAFEVVKVIPGPGKINAETKIELENIPSLINKEIPKVTFSEIIGNKIAKDKCKIILEYLKDPKKFGEWAPRNVLFYGPPGTGKTMTARALATAAKIPIYLIRATDLIGLHVGDGARRVHNLYADAAIDAPSIIFIDELDAIGLDRRYQSIRGDVSEVVNALLAEMDGLSTKQEIGVVTIGATNSPHLLDTAVRNRFEEECEFKIFDEEERLEFLQLYVKKLPIPMTADIIKISKKTENMSGREIKEKVLKVALHAAILQDLNEINSELIEDIFDKLDEKSDIKSKSMFT